MPDDIVNQYDDLKAIREKYPNLKIHFIYGRISLSDGGEARGANKANEIWVSVNELDATPEQIAKHEYFHNFIYNRVKKRFIETRGNPDDIRKAIVNDMVDRLYAKYHDDGMQSLTAAYAEMYFTDKDGNITVGTEYILEEILCDAYAGIDVLEGRDNVPARATRYNEAVNEIAAEESTENAEAVDDGGGETKYSRSENNENDRIKTRKRANISDTGNAGMPRGTSADKGQNGRGTISNSTGNSSRSGRNERSRPIERNPKAGRAWSTLRSADRNRIIDIINKYDSKNYETTLYKSRVGVFEYAKRAYSSFLKGEVTFENEYGYDFTDIEKVKDAFYELIAENPKTRFSMVTPQQDADYLSAVKRGDMETAQRMVDEAAITINCTIIYMQITAI